MTRIAFHVPAVPIAQPRQRHRIVSAKGRQFVQNYTPTKDPVNAFKATVRMAAAGVYSGAPLEGPLMLALTFVLPRPKSKQWKTKPMPQYPHTSTPDLDNLTKAVKDALKGLVWRDDCQVYDCRMRKLVAAGYEPPRVEVEISECE